nr:MAG TPA_asm: hypothetical protein [Microviridae sp.]
MNEKNYTEQYKGIIMLRKGKEKDEDTWFATVGRQVISDGTYKTKEELIESLENLNLETICKIILGAFGRVLELSTKNEEQ